MNRTSLPLRPRGTRTPRPRRCPGGVPTMRTSERTRILEAATRVVRREGVKSVAFDSLAERVAASVPRRGAFSRSVRARPNPTFALRRTA